MSFIDQTALQSVTQIVKDTLAQWRGHVLPMSMEAKIVCAILAVIALWGLAIFTFGVPALVWPMAFIVPGLVLGLVLLTWGM